MFASSTHITMWARSSHLRLTGRGIPTPKSLSCLGPVMNHLRFGLPQGQSPGPPMEVGGRGGRLTADP